MIGKVALGGICAGLALCVAVRSDNEVVRAAAAVAGSCSIGFTVTTLVLKRQQERKTREVHADMYIEMLRQMHTQQPPAVPQQPPACRGCYHYHGRVYGGNLLVCAMHPYGVEDDRCDDWQNNEADDLDDFHQDDDI
ncbi:MAG: hypothetical protein HC769_01390 [Cyanobacteria bacterium CRU_2_1]|nr:hypothetical protein [Cyanobacteria bacterium RU_5_0]NJR57618.1 hypothetical protein [Cyanobacteria bacterium CRU_2_1]